MVKAKFGLLKPIKSNRLMVHQYIIKLLEDCFPDLRLRDRPGILALATDLVFIPLQDEIDARKVRGCTRAMELIEEYNRPIYGNYGVIDYIRASLGLSDVKPLSFEEEA